MKVLKIIGIILLVVLIVFTVFCTIYFFFANEGYGVDMFNEMFEDGFFVGIKNFFVDIWKGIKYVFGI